MQYSKWLPVLFSAFVLTLFCNGSFAQTEIKLIKKIDEVYDMVEADNLGSVFAIRKGVVQKYSSSGDPVIKNSEKLLGEVSRLDATNPLKMLVFFQGLSQVSYVDNQLARRGDIINLDRLGYAQTSAVCTSYNNGFWLFDQFTFQLVRVDDRLNETNKTPNLRQLLGVVINPVKLIETSKWLYLLDKENGVYVFDLYGTYYKRIPITGITDFDIENNQLYYLKDDHIHRFDVQSLNDQTFEVPVSEIHRFSVHGNRINLVTNQALYIFELRL